jgi:5'-nucleotidase
VMERRVDLRRNPYYWIGFKRVRSNPRKGTDLSAIYEKRISISPLHLNLTAFGVLSRLKAAIDTRLPAAARRPGDASVLLPQDDAKAATARQTLGPGER